MRVYVFLCTYVYTLIFLKKGDRVTILYGAKQCNAMQSSLFVFFFVCLSFSTRDQSLASIKYFSQKILGVGLVIVSRLIINARVYVQFSFPSSLNAAREVKSGLRLSLFLSLSLVAETGVARWMCSKDHLLESSLFLSLSFVLWHNNQLTSGLLEQRVQWRTNWIRYSSLTFLKFLRIFAKNSNAL